MGYRTEDLDRIEYEMDRNLRDKVFVPEPLTEKSMYRSAFLELDAETTTHSMEDHSSEIKGGHSSATGKDTKGNP